MKESLGLWSGQAWRLRWRMDSRICSGADMKACLGSEPQSKSRLCFLEATLKLNPLYFPSIFSF